jgi:hypothetical protein
MGLVMGWAETYATIKSVVIESGQSWLASSSAAPGTSSGSGGWLVSGHKKSPEHCPGLGAGWLLNIHVNGFSYFFCQRQFPQWEFCGRRTLPC